MEQDKILRWMIYFFVCSISLFTLGVAFHVFALLFERYDLPKNWDLLGFVGALLGGALTLVGVQITLRNQQKMELLKNAPKVRRAADYVLTEVRGVVITLSSLEFWRPLGGVPTIIQRLENFMSHSQMVSEKAAEVSEETYIKTREFSQQVLPIIVNIRDITDLGELKDYTFYQTCLANLEHSQSEIENQINEAISRYKK